MTASLLAPLLLAATAAEPAPTPSPTPTELTIYTVSPGIWGFTAFFVLALIGWLLFRSLTKHVRKVDLETRRREQAGAGQGGAEAPKAVASADEPGER